jgi:hypothetical protein
LLKQIDSLNAQIAGGAATYNSKLPKITDEKNEEADKTNKKYFNYYTGSWVDDPSKIVPPKSTTTSYEPTTIARGTGGVGSMMLMSSGGMVAPKYFASGGFSRGSDTVPAMLTPGEFVMSKYAVDSYGTDKMKAINSGTYEGEKVYNYNLSVNVKSDSNPDDIARVVIKQIQQLDNQRIRKQAN